MLRVVAFGSYKKPRELNWIVGVLLLLIILGFALTGYLLPWDQKAYWATTVTLNIARSVPLVGGFAERTAERRHRPRRADVDAVVRGACLPAARVPDRLHGCAHLPDAAAGHLGSGQAAAGPVDAVLSVSRASRDTIAIAAVFALLLTLAIAFNAPLDAVADPTDATYVPRPEWYFMSLFELLKHFPGPLEPVATMVIPGIVITLLFLLPFLDRRPDRAPAKRPLVIGSFAIVFTGIALLTVLRDSGPRRLRHRQRAGGARGRARPLASAGP